MEKVVRTQRIPTVFQENTGEPVATSQKWFRWLVGNGLKEGKKGREAVKVS